MCSFGYTFFNFGGFIMDKLKVGLFSKVLRDSIDEDIRKVVLNYAKYLEPTKEAMTDSEATLALYKIKEIISDESLCEKDKAEKIRDVFEQYDLDFDSFEY